MQTLNDRRGEAGRAKDVLSDTPLQIISRPLYAPRETEPDLNLKRWQVPVLRSDAIRSSDPLAEFEKVIDANDVDLGWQDRAFRDMLAKHAEFAIGGIRAFSYFGIKAAWLRDQEIREHTRSVIEERNWWPLLSALRYKENSPTDLIGLKDITRYWRAATDDTGLAWDQSGTPDQRRRERRSTTLRLRKAIELICILETVLDHRWKHSPRRMQDAYEALTGERLKNPDGSFVWDMVWIEPIIYSVSPRPRRADVARIMEFAGRKFEADSGQTVKSLYRILAGATCSWSTAKIAADYCNRYYGFSDSKKIGGRLALTRAVSARPSEYQSRMTLAQQDEDPFSFARMPKQELPFSDAPPGACTTFYETFDTVMDAPHFSANGQSATAH